MEVGERGSIWAGGSEPGVKSKSKVVFGSRMGVIGGEGNSEELWKMVTQGVGLRGRKMDEVV